MLTVHLLRHGQTAWNIERRFMGRSDVPLDPTGEAQVAGLRGVFPKVDAVYASPLQRAWRTALIVGEPVAHPALVEMDMGVLEGMNHKQVLEANYADLLVQFKVDPTKVVIPGGETLSQSSSRMATAFWEIVGPHPEGTIAIVSHQMAMASMLCALTSDSLAAYSTFTQRNTAWTTIEVHRGERAEIRVIARDQAPHLDRLG